MQQKRRRRRQAKAPGARAQLTVGVAPRTVSEPAKQGDRLGGLMASEERPGWAGRQMPPVAGAGARGTWRDKPARPALVSGKRAGRAMCPRCPGHALQAAGPEHRLQPTDLAGCRRVALPSGTSEWHIRHVLHAQGLQERRAAKPTRGCEPWGAAGVGRSERLQAVLPGRAACRTVGPPQRYLGGWTVWRPRRQASGWLGLQLQRQQARGSLPCWRLRRRPAWLAGWLALLSLPAGEEPA